MAKWILLSQFDIYGGERLHEKPTVNCTTDNCTFGVQQPANELPNKHGFRML